MSVCMGERDGFIFKGLTCTMVGADKSKISKAGQPTGDPGKADVAAQGQGHLETEFPLP